MSSLLTAVRDMALNMQPFAATLAEVGGETMLSSVIEDISLPAFADCLPEVAKIRQASILTAAMQAKVGKLFGSPERILEESKYQLSLVPRLMAFADFAEKKGNLLKAALLYEKAGKIAATSEQEKMLKTALEAFDARRKLLNYAQIDSSSEAIDTLHGVIYFKLASIHLEKGNKLQSIPWMLNYAHVLDRLGGPGQAKENRLLALDRAHALLREARVGHNRLLEAHALKWVGKILGELGHLLEAGRFFQDATLLFIQVANVSGKKGRFLNLGEARDLHHLRGMIFLHYHDYARAGDALFEGDRLTLEEFRGPPTYGERIFDKSYDRLLKEKDLKGVAETVYQRARLRYRLILRSKRFNLAHELKNIQVLCHDAVKRFRIVRDLKQAAEAERLYAESLLTAAELVCEPGSEEFSRTIEQAQAIFRSLHDEDGFDRCQKLLS
ncbi:MAG: hypothetical protein Q7T03_07980 [Deltaproteobacteria bacterium]|nr:hypothetical protein [Deltaproteobacteria bacterium]